MILFRATSHHQLINAIAIKIVYFPNEVADLILSNMTDFTSILERLKNSKLFRKVYYVDDVTVAKNFIAKTKEERYRASKKVLNWWNIDLDVIYDDYFYGHDILCNKLFYYYLCSKQKQPIPHSFQEGVSSYLTNIFNRGDGDSIAHSYYGEKSLLKALADFYFYYPNNLLYKSPIPIRKIETNNEKIKKCVKEIYCPPPLPKEKFIYIACCSEFQGVSSNEIEIVNFISEQVGKDNIVIKTHPRCTHDNFSFRGYHVMDSSVAWEAYALDDQLKDKILISAISTSVFATVSLAPENIRSLMLNKIFICDLSKFVAMKNMNKFLEKVCTTINEENKCLYEAQSFDELKMQLLYWKGKIK